MTGFLDIHVFGGAIGESIVVHLPDGKWGVVDCYTRDFDRPESNYPLQFLNSRGVREVEFVCLTHPHVDHFRGMSQLLENLHVRQFWRFSANTTDNLRRIINHVEASVNWRDRDKASELSQIFAVVAARRRAKTLKVRRLENVQVLYQSEVDASEPPIEIACVCPSSGDVERYEDGLAQCFDEGGNIKPNPVRLEHNEISSALVIEFGETRFVLGGDVERGAWEQAVAECERQSRTLSSVGVKVSHHGSTNGYSRTLWSTFCASTDAYAVITPFLRHGLPSKDAVQHIRGYTKNVYTTSRSVMREMTESFDCWDDYPIQVQIALRACSQSFRVERDLHRGSCSLRFDGHGRCIEVHCGEDAGPV